ncbi:hypothetical protein HMPREF1988_02012, partial [Porphyromonas gingivalis F0185]
KEVGRLRFYAYYSNILLKQFVPKSCMKRLSYYLCTAKGEFPKVFPGVVR